MSQSFKDIEYKWQQEWENAQIYKSEINNNKPKFYVLDMFPYPSGAGLHVGHPLGYIASDIVSRYKRLKGFNVLHPMGFDAFGLPAEQYAIQTGQHPSVTTAQNIDTYKKQLKKIGFCYDWSREVNTSEAGYYKWTQWIFLKLFNSWYNLHTHKAESIQQLIDAFNLNGTEAIKGFSNQSFSFTSQEWKSKSETEQQHILMQYRLAYQDFATVNWCEALGTVLANDEVKDGLSERGGHPVERKQMRQWFLRITAFADRLLNDLDQLAWSDAMKEMQRNWIGKSQGASVKFELIKTENSTASSLTPNPSPRERRTSYGYKTADTKSYDELKDFARDMRKNSTEEEDLIWQSIRGAQLGFNFRRQHVILDYIVDFVCLEKRLIVEIDGEIHKFQFEYDKGRETELSKFDFEIIRFSNQEVTDNIDQVLNEIKSVCQKRPSFEPLYSYSISPSPLEKGSGAEASISSNSNSPSPMEKGLGDEASENLNSNSSSHKKKGLRDEASQNLIEVFTTRPDTIFGVSFLVIAPEHELVEQITTNEFKTDVENYVQLAKNRSERERQSEVKRVSGVFTGAFVSHPFTNEKIPVWIADYVLAGYGTGAVMAVPAGDQRDYAFAKQFNLPIPPINEGVDIAEQANPTKEAKMINSGFLNGLTGYEAIPKAIEAIEAKGIGKGKVQFRLRDAGFSRQRYWGEPFPIVYKNGVAQALNENELPLELPNLSDFKPTGKPESPLAKASDWVNLADGSIRETDTMPGYAGSSWYFLRYMDPQNTEAFVSKEAENYWQDVDLYIGGTEHAVGHLLYSRFWHKVLFDLGFVSKNEPFKQLVNQGMILGRSNFVYRKTGTNLYTSHDLITDFNLYTAIHVDVNIVSNDVLELEKFKHWRDDFKNAEFELNAQGNYICGVEVEKMSKSKYNVVNPDDIISEYGADTLRLYEMFLGPLEQSKPWNTNGIEGVYRFLNKLWRLYIDEKDQVKISHDVPLEKELRALHKLIKKVDEDIEKFSFNTSVSQFMICVNELAELKCNKSIILKDLLVVIAPFAPHMAEELWHRCGFDGFVVNAHWPVFNPAYLIESSVIYPVAFNGKTRFQLEVAANIDLKLLEKLALENEEAQKWLDGKAPKKVIVVPGRMVNVVV